MSAFLPFLTLFGWIIAAGFALSLLFSLIRRPQSWFAEVLKNTLGALFVFSGSVKAVDPMGTSLKIQEYFAEFHLEALNPVTLELSIFVITLEVALGFMLLLGVWRKFTLWTMGLMLLYFAFQTGYTSITHHVTDCGCFGDFLKLEPYVSFTKDLILIAMLIPLLIKPSNVVQLFRSSFGESIAVLATVVGFFVCVQNYYWNEPIVDFRPFRAGVNIPATKQAERDEEQKLPMFLIYENTKTHETKDIDVNDAKLMGEIAGDAANWKYKDRKTIGVAHRTKISDFLLNGNAGQDVTDSLMNAQGYALAIIVSNWQHTDKAAFAAKLNKLAAEAEKDHVAVYGVMNIASPADIDAFRHDVQAAFPFYTADDKLLKTMIRSNPGVFLFKEGTIVQKWHRRKLPEYNTIKTEFMK